MACWVAIGCRAVRVWAVGVGLLWWVLSCGCGGAAAPAGFVAFCVACEFQAGEGGADVVDRDARSGCDLFGGEAGFSVHCLVDAQGSVGEAVCFAGLLGWDGGQVVAESAY